MRSLRFLLSRRWVAFFLVVVVLGYAAWWLGRWQFHRLEDRKDDNAVVERNEGAAPVAASEVLAPGRDVDPDDEWRAVTATGTYLPDETVIVRYRTRDGSAGVDVVVPLQTAEGPALLVDRGWLATDNSGATPDDVPAPRPARSPSPATYAGTRPATPRRSPTARRGPSPASGSGRRSAERCTAASSTSRPRNRNPRRRW